MTHRGDFEFQKKLLIVLTGSIVGFLISMKLFDMFGADI